MHINLVSTRRYTEWCSPYGVKVHVDGETHPPCVA